ncbi:MAG: hypothetical protein CVV35_06280 [Methanomicrobiales archaeon HGW-Methanomicrobiales-6]|nr:MAG: hypothetical protein CVV35_06280 [Methanomicrobiales archaeon HGW-Methanomicrobiales-6]
MHFCSIQTSLRTLLFVANWQSWVKNQVRALEQAANPKQETAARRRLTEIGSPALPQLIPLLNSRSDEVVLRAIGAMEAIGDPAAVDPLLPHLSDRRYSVRARAARALGRLGDPRARLALMRALKDREPEVRRAAREALGEMKGR